MDGQYEKSSHMQLNPSGISLELRSNCASQLTGSSGQAILSQLEGSAHAVNASTNTSLWNWGSIPVGYTLNQSGILDPLDETVLSNDYNVWTPSI